MKLLKRQPARRTKMNITPMIDVVFLLIIFFMVISQFQKIEMEQLELPKASAEQLEEQRKPTRLIVNVHADGRIIVEQTNHSLDSFRRLLKKEIDGANGATPSVLLRGDRQSAWGAIRELLRLCTEFNIHQVEAGIQEPGGKE